MAARLNASAHQIADVNMRPPAAPTHNVSIAWGVCPPTSLDRPWSNARVSLRGIEGLVGGVLCGLSDQLADMLEALQGDGIKQIN